MCPSPSNIPINISLTSFGIFTAALSEGDKRIIPLVERPVNNLLVSIKDLKGNKSFYELLSHNIIIMIGLYHQFIPFSLFFSFFLLFSRKKRGEKGENNREKRINCLVHFL